MTDHVLLAAGQATAALTNADGTQNVYLTSDPSVNALTLTLRNGLDHPVVFPAGTAVAYGDLPAGQSAVYIFLSGLLANADVAAIVPAAPGWVPGTYTDPATGFQYLVIAPTTQVTVRPGDTLAFTLTHVLAAGEQRSGTAEIGLAGATGLTQQQRDVPLFVHIASPPQPGDKPLEADVDISFERPFVYTGQAQSLTLRLFNKRKTALVPDGTPSWHGHTPTFQLTLVYGDGAGALTTVALAAQIGMKIYDEYGNDWQEVVPHDQVQGPYWTMQPNPEGGGTVLGTGADATIEFAITGIEATPLPAGLESADTVAYVSWYHVPGYHGGATAVIINKRAGPQVTLSADPPSVPFGAPAVHTVLKWDASNASGVWFDAPGVDPAALYKTSGNGPGDGISVQPGTTVTVTAYKDVAADLTPGTRAPRQPAENVLEAYASLRFIRPARTDLTAPVGSLGAFAIPAGSTRAFVFQRNRGQVSSSELTQAVIFDLQKQAFTGTLNIKALVPSQGGGTLIHDVTPSPDGTTIHVLASSGEGASWLTPQFYLLPLEVASATFGTAVSLGTLVPSGWAAEATFLATPDGRTIYVSACDLKTAYSHVYAIDTATHAVRGSWTWQEPYQQIGPAVPAACTRDGNVLLMAGWAGLAVIDVPSGFTMTGLWTTKDLKLVMGQTLISPDRTRAYACGIDSFQDPIHAQLLVIDVDLAAGALSLAKNKPLGLVPALAGAPALAPDARTFYVVTDVDKLTALDTATFAVVPYYCGTGGQFTPVTIAAGPQPGVLYGTGNNGYTNAVVSVVTLA